MSYNLYVYVYIYISLETLIYIHVRNDTCLYYTCIIHIILWDDACFVRIIYTDWGSSSQQPLRKDGRTWTLPTRSTKKDRPTSPESSFFFSTHRIKQWYLWIVKSPAGTRPWGHRWSRSASPTSWTSATNFGGFWGPSATHQRSWESQSRSGRGLNDFTYEKMV
jgi:hypothetical protein